MAATNGVLRYAILLGCSLLVGCSTPYIRGQAALFEGRYGEAADHFQDVLAHDPSRLDALVGLGISRYKTGKLDEAVVDLDRVLVEQADSKTARLYLALGFLRRGDDQLAEDALVKLRGLKPHPRLAAQIDRSLRLIGPSPRSCGTSSRHVSRTRPTGYGRAAKAGSHAPALSLGAPATSGAWSPSSSSGSAERFAPL